MNQETKICQNCKQEFVIEPEDFNFYRKIDVPPPTFCPMCRFQRRYAFRNEMNLYRVKCGLCGKDTVSIYSAEKPFPIYCQQCWWSDKWDATTYAQKYDFSKPFFVQFRELMYTVPRLGLDNTNSINSEYCNYSIDNKNCYLCFSIGNSEDCYYMGPQIVRSKSCVSCSMSKENEFCYEVVDCSQSYKLFFSQNCRACLESAFLFDCRNCKNCIGCVNLRNKQYYIFNKPYSKEDYFRELRGLNMGSYRNLVKFQKRFHDLLLKNIHRFAVIENAAEVTGDNIFNSQRCSNCFVTLESEDCKHCFVINNCKNSYDIHHSYPDSELSYEVMSLVESTRIKLSFAPRANSIDDTYIDTCASTLNSFGCISLKHKRYCILNKEYTKDEYEELIPKIIEYMNEMPYIDKKGRTYRYGEFFPIELSPFAYNETVAQNYIPLSKEEVLKQGYLWKDTGERKDQPETTISWRDLPDHIKNVPDSIIDEIISCRAWDEDRDTVFKHNCTAMFKIIPKELELYRIMNVPLPRICPNTRRIYRLQRRNFPKLHHRQCMCDYEIYQNTTKHQHHSDGRCPNEFETTYSPERKETVYCEQCYNAEIV